MALQITEDGSHTVFSERFGETYHSRHGALTESGHVFINAGLTYAVEHGLSEIEILEAGFGTGLNALMTWMEAEKRQLSVSYTGIEAYPVSIQDAEQLNYPATLGAPEWSGRFMQLHQLPWGERSRISGKFNLLKINSLIQEFTADSAFDVVYFDAFAPQTQPELWTAEVMVQLFHALRPGGVLVTYCAQGAFRRNLKAAGFVVESLPGPPFKREMTRALRPA